MYLSKCKPTDHIKITKNCGSLKTVKNSTRLHVSCYFSTGVSSTAQGPRHTWSWYIPGPVTGSAEESPDRIQTDPSAAWAGNPFWRHGTQLPPPRHPGARRQDNDTVTLTARSHHTTNYCEQRSAASVRAYGLQRTAFREVQGWLPRGGGICILLVVPTCKQ